MIRFLLYALLIWFLYNLLFRFIIPIYKTTRQVKKRFREMSGQMQNQQTVQQNFGQEPPAQTSTTGPRSEDYIDFEEIK